MSVAIFIPMIVNLLGRALLVLGILGLASASSAEESVTVYEYITRSGKLIEIKDERKALLSNGTLPADLKRVDERLRNIATDAGARAVKAGFPLEFSDLEIRAVNGFSNPLVYIVAATYYKGGRVLYLIYRVDGVFLDGGET